MKNAEDMMNENRKRRAGAGVMSAKLFGAFVGGMTSNLNDFDTLKRQTKEFANVFEKTNYPYSEEYLENIKKDAGDKLEEAWINAIRKLRDSELGNASGSEAVRQARLAHDIRMEKPNRIKVSKD